jgi:hypothetical protein
MSALPKWASLRETVYQDAMLANGQAHLESPEVPQWVDEMGEDMGGALCDAVSLTKGKERDRLNGLLVDLCRKGDDIEQRKTVELLDLLRARMTTYCIDCAQHMVDERLPV